MSGFAGLVFNVLSLPGHCALCAMSAVCNVCCVQCLLCVMSAVCDVCCETAAFF